MLSIKKIVIKIMEILEKQKFLKHFEGSDVFDALFN